jgi:hypothetical protein
MPGKKMEGIGCHYSTTAGHPVKGHSLVQSLYVLLGRQCPLEPQLYRQKKTCQAEGVAFGSKVALMEALIRQFEPVADTRTHVLLDAWYSAKLIRLLADVVFISPQASKATDLCVLGTRAVVEAGSGSRSKRMPNA